MIQNQVSLELYNKEQEELSREIESYKRINASLKKKIQARDKKITYLFSCIDPSQKNSSKSTIQNSNVKKNKSQIETLSMSKREVCFTEPKNKQKQNFVTPNQNIFKEKMFESSQGTERLNFRLPALERKNIFAENPEVTDSRPKIIKISIEKLIPLKAQQVKKKFESKFK